MERWLLRLELIMAALLVASVTGYWPAPAAGANPALSAFPTSRREIAHGPHWTSTMEYSVAGDPAIDALIQSLVVDDCYPGMMSVDDGRCEQRVIAKVVRSVYLVVIIENFEYQTGAAHGSDQTETRTFKRVAGSWVQIADDMVSEAQECQERIGDVVYKSLRPSLPPDFIASLDKSHRLLDIGAPQLLTDDGIVLEFQQYEFGTYAPPTPITLDWRLLGSCFQPKVSSPNVEN